MPIENTNWEIELLMKRFDLEPLSITYEQAEKIYEQEKSIGSIVHSFSVWETLDYQLSYLTQILDENQLKKFIDFERESISGFEESLVKQDQDCIKQVEVAEAQLAYYQEKLLPSIFADYNLLLLGLDSVRPKINYLKASYRHYLDNRKKEVILSHVRNSRSFQPNLLKLAFIHHQLACLFPDYHLFKGYMDEPTKAVKDYLVEALENNLATAFENLKAMLQELQDFTTGVVREKLGTIQGWHVTHHQSETQKREYRLMCLVLLDRDKYGC